MAFDYMEIVFTPEGGEPFRLGKVRDANAAILMGSVKRLPGGRGISCVESGGAVILTHDTESGLKLSEGMKGSLEFPGSRLSNAEIIAVESDVWDHQAKWVRIIFSGEVENVRSTPEEVGPNGRPYWGLHAKPAYSR